MNVNKSAMMTFGTMALSIHVWIKCSKGEKSNAETVLV